MIVLTSKLGEINDIEYNKGSKIYPQNQVILDCIVSSIPLKHKCLSIFWHGSLFLISSSEWSLKKSKSKKKKIYIYIFFFTFLNWEKQTWYWEKRWLFLIGNGGEIRPLEKGRKSPVIVHVVVVAGSSGINVSIVAHPHRHFHHLKFWIFSCFIM